MDPEDAKLIKKSGIKVFTMEHIDFRGMREVMEQAPKAVTSGTKGVHLNFDLDVIDSFVAPGVGTPIQGGISCREVHLAMEIIAGSNMLRYLEFVEVNPILDSKNKTGKLAVDLACSALGKRIF